ncbi:hypothetical protein LSH36_615g00021 [Paralvinella palmiformis]|uniref:Uncharacterized protein n=1 Tax=Paralvinella palmiformis TaxID=53620 RepID=A0AAD9MUW2_9ANNE|nr:hypothetical protein LSH36_615g00021 [Paralvinella palmiformis]
MSNNLVVIRWSSLPVVVRQMAEMTHWTTVGLIICLALLTWRDLTSPTDAQKTTKDIPMPKLSKLTGPTLRFLF